MIIDNRPISYLQPIIDDHMRFLPGWDLVHLTPPINTLRDYNYFMTSISTWDIPYEKVLIFQHDSRILREGIDEFMGVDYIGAPWAFQEHGGNGGFSLRTVDVMRRIIRARQYSPALGYEDVYFCNEMHQRGLNLASREECKRFSCEAIFELGTFGYHAIDKYLTKQECEQIRNQYICNGASS